MRGALEVARERGSLGSGMSPLCQRSRVRSVESGVVSGHQVRIALRAGVYVLGLLDTAK